MNTQKLYSFWPFLWISLVLIAVGWGGLAYIILMELPTLAPRWLFFFFLTLALTGTALPVVYFLNRRFPTEPPPDGSVLMREAMWLGIYGSLLAWLQLGRVMTSGLAVVLATGMILVEFLLRLAERSRWSPTETAAGTSEEAALAGESDSLVEEEDE